MELTINDIREQLKIHCPGEAFHADNKTHAELIANRFMDCTAILLGEIERIEKQTADKWISVDDRLPELHQYVTLMDVNRYANNADIPVNNEHVIQAGYLDEFGSKHWSVYGERALCLNAFTHWCLLPPPPE